MKNSKGVRQTGRFVWQVKSGDILSCSTGVAGYLQTNIFSPFEQFEQEEFWVLLLNKRQRLTHQLMVYRGTVDLVMVRPAELFREAIRLNACALILAHNHPSGDASPSDEDIRVTKHIKEAGVLLGIEVIDHFVVGKDSWTSFREQGL